MKKIILIFFLLFAFEAKADPWVAFFTGLLEGMVETQDEKKAFKKTKGSPSDYNEMKKFAGCAQYVERQEKYNPLNLKAPVPASISYTHLGDNTYANDNEKDLIVAFIEEMEVCIQRANPSRVGNTALRGLFLQSQNIWSQTIMDFISVYNETMTWGQLNKNNQQRASMYQQYVNQWEISTDAQLESQYQQINQYWNDYRNERVQQRQNTINNYLNRKKDRCRWEDVYDKYGNSKRIQNCSNPYLMPIN